MDKARNKPLTWVKATDIEEEASFRVLEPSPPSGVQAGTRTEQPTSARLLLVDDDPVILRTLVRQLKLHRPTIEVVVAADGTSAVELLKQNRFDVMITDLQMPGMRGEELLVQAQELDPTLTCIVHSNQVLCMPSELRGRVRATLNKPSSITEICDALDDAVRRADRLRDSLLWL
ncbi:MAG: response regulator [Polyangiaceae bacterium]|nr:response regulator [Polyangiaceae bacterium]